MIVKFAYGGPTYLLFKDSRRDPLDQVVTGSYSELAQPEKQWTLSVALFGVSVRRVS
jgi:hypothetical protein